MKLLLIVVGCVMVFFADISGAYTPDIDCDCTLELETLAMIEESLVPHDDFYGIKFKNEMPEGDGVIEMFTGVQKEFVLNGEGQWQEVCMIITEEFLLDIDEAVQTDEDDIPLILLEDEMTLLPINQIFELVEESGC